MGTNAILKHPQIVAAIAEATGEKKTTVERILRAQSALIKEQVRATGGVRLLDVGVIHGTVRPPRRVYVPSSEAFREVAARKGVKFRASKRLLD